ncbi:hypothetical protein ABIE85_006260 [Bradyrhizobium diazoefficiens]|uniref:hypothetical protein n=1 Tax=Bradyrhizobium diazoefficiens TaxID=1355477 RepID=UPI003513D119
MELKAERDAAEFFISRLQSQIVKLELRQYPGDLPGPKDWLRLCEALVETALQYLRAAEDGKASRSSKVKSLKEANRVGNNVYRLLVEMEGAGADALPYAIVAPMQRWIDELGIQNVTFFRSLSVANYELQRFNGDDYEGIRDPSPNLKTILEQQHKWPYLRITVPGKALNILPHFAIVAHEIGHILHDQKAGKFPFSKSDERNFEKRVLQQTSTNEFGEKERIFLHDVTQRWATELFADAIGIRLLGPAFFFALCAFIENIGQGQIASRTHPPARVRRKIAFKNLDHAPKYSFKKSFKKLTGVELTESINSSLLEGDIGSLPSHERLIRVLSGRFPANEAAILGFLPDLIETIADKVYKEAERIVSETRPSLLYTSAQFESDLREHLDNLINAVPPIESGMKIGAKVPTELASILNVGWAALLTKLDGLAVREEGAEFLSAEKSEKLHSLLIKAVELSEARRKWMQN